MKMFVALILCRRSLLHTVSLRTNLQRVLSAKFMRSRGKSLSCRCHWVGWAPQGGPRPSAHWSSWVDLLVITAKRQPVVAEQLAAALMNGAAGSHLDAAGDSTHDAVLLSRAFIRSQGGLLASVHFTNFTVSDPPQLRFSAVPRASSALPLAPSSLNCAGLPVSLDFCGHHHAACSVVGFWDVWVPQKQVRPHGFVARQGSEWVNVRVQDMGLVRPDAFGNLCLELVGVRFLLYRGSAAGCGRVTGLRQRSTTHDGAACRPRSLRSSQARRAAHG